MVIHNPIDTRKSWSEKKTIVLNSLANERYHQLTSSQIDVDYR